MKFFPRRLIPVLALPLFSLALGACSTTTFMHTSGTGVQRGSGGAYRMVDGIEFYQEGSPNRPYQVIGVITDSRPVGPWTMGPRADTVAKLALQNGGQAVVQQSDVREFVGYSTSNNTNYYQYQNANWNRNGGGYNQRNQGGNSYGNWRNGNANSSSYGTAYGNSTTTALYNAHSRFLVIRYR